MIGQKRQEKQLQDANKLAQFEQAILPHLDAGYNLARWLTHNDSDAADLTQEAILRAFKFFAGFHGSNGRAWLLRIVRNTCYTWLQQNLSPELTTSFEEEMRAVESDASNPETMLLQNANTQLLREALEQLPIAFREIIVLRDLEGLSYKEIADIAGLPLGTVMSRLARAHKRLQHDLVDYMNKEI